MRCICQIFFLAVATATAVPTLAGPPAFANPGRKPSAPPARVVPKPVLQIQPRFNPPQGPRTVSPRFPIGRPGTPMVKPTVPVFKPTIRPTQPTFKPTGPLVRPTPPAIRPNVPTVTVPSPGIAQPLIGRREFVPKDRAQAPQPGPIGQAIDQAVDGRKPVFAPRRRVPLEFAPQMRVPLDTAAGGAVQPGDLVRIREDLDRDNDGVVDAFEPGNLPVLDEGHAGGGDGAANPPVAGDPGAAGPTAWDWVAIGLSAAALADSLADRGGGFVNGGVVVERPIVQTVPVAETVVIRDQPVVVHEERIVVQEQPVVVHEEPVVVPDEQVTVAEQPDVTAIGEPAVVETPAPAAAQPRPQLRVGTAFELPAKGLGAKPGRVAVKVGAVILECPVSNWNDGGLRATVAEMTLAAATPADLIVALADGAVAARIPVDLLPAAVQVAGRSE